VTGIVAGGEAALDSALVAEHEQPAGLAGDLADALADGIARTQEVDVLTLRTPSMAAGARDRRGRALGGTGASPTGTALRDGGAPAEPFW
jgi:hypothetical protein